MVNVKETYLGYLHRSVQNSVLGTITTGVRLFIQYQLIFQELFRQSAKKRFLLSVKQKTLNKEPIYLVFFTLGK